ncbi:response regulator [Streptomyces sp. NPDC005574]|uniref:response regulator n=1 Tax=Streptomyces sp. NPDC005574 TaxID=3156891 RepID=UPI0033A6C68D
MGGACGAGGSTAPEGGGAEVGKSRTRWPVPTYSRVVPGASGRVLVVDDNKVIRQLIRVNLELEGLEVVTAADGAECLDVVHQVRPDVVTLDVVMPRLDGLRTAARLRSDPRTRHLPLAIVSACTQYEVESGLDVGVDAFLAKPFEPAELVRLVRQLVERTRSVPAADGEASVLGGDDVFDVPEGERPDPVDRHPDRHTEGPDRHTERAPHSERAPYGERAPHGERAGQAGG